LRKRLAISVLLMGTAFLIVLNSISVSSLGNPAASYCEQLGYKYEVVNNNGGESGVCIVNGKAIEEWKFYSGEEGAEYSWCAKNGYKLVTKTDGKNPYSKNYAVCLGKKKEEIRIPYENFIKIDDSVKDLETNSKLGSSSMLQTKSYSYPDYFDWRDVNGSNYITTVKNQGQYPYCSEFAVVAGVEAQRNIETNNPEITFDLSEQDAISCPLLGALKQSINPGLVDEACFPYNGNMIDCSLKCSDWQGRLTRIYESDWIYNSEEAKYWVSTRGGVYTGIYMGGYFDNGIYRCDSTLIENHAILIIGYNETGQYWIAKNSWGSWWNGDGYFKIAYGNCRVDPRGYFKYFECQSGELRSCSKTQGVCSVGLSEMCVGNGWGGCNYNSIPGYEETETSCDGLDNDCDGEVDEGVCSACYSNSDCGTNGWVGTDLCGSGINNVYNTFRTYTCNNPGLPSASCTNTNTLQVKTTCSYPQACITGSCQNYYGCFDDDALGLLTKSKTVVNGLTYNDYCDAKGQLIEYICTKGKVKAQKIKCTCSNGACTRESVCSETDNGLDFYNRGSVGLFNVNYEDYCDAKKGGLVEYYCKKYNKIGTKKVKCSCVDGKCI